MNAAKMDAVRKAVIDLIGREAEAAQAELLDEVLYSTRNPNAFVYNDTMETLRKEGSLIEGDMIYEMRVRVNVEAVRRTLAANGISGDVPADTGPGGAAEDDRAAADGGRRDGADDDELELGGATADGPLPEPDYGDITASERRFIARFVDTMTYLVSFSERAAATIENGEFLMRSAVNQANSYLVSQGRLVIDARQVEQLKEDRQLVYEEQVGAELSVLQWVARRLDADVYIELDASISTRSERSRHYATADITLNMYETSTGQVLGSVNRRSREAFSRTSADDAASNALQSTVYQAMPRAVEMAERQMQQALARGIRYELIMQRPPDARSLSRFRSLMRDEVREIATVSQSPDEVLYEVFFIGGTDDLVDLVFRVTERAAGFEDMTLVLSRGQSLTFDVGF
jgi:hypothetical protein